MSNPIKTRLAYFFSFIALFIAEVFIALYVHDDFLRPYGGDIIVVVLLYFFVRMFIPDKIKLLPLYLFIFATLIEIGQYFNYAELLGVANSPALSTVLGSSFSWYDIACYAAGSIICIPLQAAVNRKRRK